MTFMHYDLEKLVDKNHPLRKTEETVSFGSLAYRLKKLDNNLGRKGYGAEVGLRCLYLQFHYDLSDRAMEEELRDRSSFRWFCGFKIGEQTPDHSYFGRMREVIGTKKIGQIFNAIVKKAEDKSVVRKVFKFVDATAIKSKETTWKERDKAIADGEEKLNNDNIGKYSSDKDARFGCKGKDKFWYGYKANAACDMGSMIITKIAVTPANIPDEHGFKHICPRYGEMVFGDKSYCLKPALHEMLKRGCYSAAILKNNMKNKNKDLDKWRSKMRSPFECIFSKFEKRTRYRGLAKVQFQLFMDAIVWNTKRLIKINAPPLFSATA
jgi:transposase, IS5 family